MFYSQQGEDEYIFTNYLNEPDVGGTFIELGAVDGKLYSNTLFFEEHLGYSGVLIEPQPAMFNKLCQNRPGNVLVNAAVTDNSDADTESFLGVNATGGLTSSMAASFRDRWHSTLGSEHEYQVEVLPMSRIIADAGLEYIDLLSLDVEGGELAVLRSIDWDAVSIYLVLIELDRHDRERNEECRSILREGGYESKGRVGINDLWLLPDYPRSDRLFTSEV